MISGALVSCSGCPLKTAACFGVVGLDGWRDKVSKGPMRLCRRKVFVTVSKERGNANMAFHKQLLIRKRDSAV